METTPELIGEETAKAVQETAKTTGKAVDLLSKLGDSAAGKAASRAVAEGVGILGDWAHRKREKYAAEVVEQARAIMHRRGKTLPSPDDDVPLSIVEPVLEAASGESRAELQDLWARLLAAAVDPERTRQVRLEFIQAAKQMAPLDAAALKKLEEVANPSPNTRDYLASALKMPSDEVEVSLENLEVLRLVFTPPQGGGISAGAVGGYRPVTNASMTAKGREFMRALRD